MCIAVPEKIVSIRETETGLWGKTERAGVVHETDLSLLGAVRAGDWVLVFRGSALRVVPEEEAKRVEAALCAVSSAAFGEEDEAMLAKGFEDLGNPDERLPLHLKAMLQKNEKDE